ncbi:hypothetical protein [Tenacibaculum dicentrarchi]|uniref:hypothetical protein n=1 Tax=Tenacibaculum dicentrarchi TaxID=669041 RepID=UPI0035186654
MKERITIIILSFFLFQSCKNNNEKIKDSFREKYLTELFSIYKGYSIGKHYIIYNLDHNFTLGTVDIELYDESLNDFNKDGTQDMWAKITDTSDGGNEFMVSYGIVQIKSPTNIDYIGYFGFGDFSNYIYNIDGFKNKTPIIKISTSHQSNMNKFPIYHINTHLGFKNGKIISLNYIDCAMSAMKNKRIFKEEYKTNYDIDPAFNQLKLEFYKEEGFEYAFSINGCNDFLLKMYVLGNQNEAVLKEKLLNTAIYKTRFKTIAKHIKNNKITVTDYFNNEREVICNECVSTKFTENKKGKNRLDISYLKRN